MFAKLSVPFIDRVVEVEFEKTEATSLVEVSGISIEFARPS
jgi:hypothetical protein